MRIRDILGIAAVAFCAIPAHAQQQPSMAQVVAVCGTPYSTYVANTTRPLTQDITGTLCSSSGGGGGGGAVTIANGADVTEGTIGDTQANGTVVGYAKSGYTTLGTIATNTTNAGTPTLQSGSTTAVTQATAANLNATVVGTGTLAVQNTAATPAGTNLVGKFGIDQTTPGTTNAVSATETSLWPVQLQDGSANSISSTANALDVNIKSGASVAQASTTSGQTGSLVQSATTTSAPTYTTAKTNPLSSDTAGNLRVVSPATTIAGAALGTAGSASSNVVTVQGVASMTKLLVTPDSVALPANQSVNQAQVNGTTILVNTGATGTGSPRVTVATDTATVAGSTPAAMGSGATGGAVPANAVYAGANSGGNVTGIIQGDTSVAINISTATTTQIVALSSGKKIYITQLSFQNGGTGNVTLEYGTGSSCGTGTTVLSGPLPEVAQSGLVAGSGLGPAIIVPASQAFCILTSAAVQTSGWLTYTQF